MKLQLVFGLAAAFSVKASIISWNVDQFGTVTNASGVVAAPNWNNTIPTGDSPYVGRIVSNLIDQTGAPTTLDLSYGSWGGWRIQDIAPGPDGDASNNKNLLNGYLNAGPAGWNPPVTASSVALSEIPYPNYDLIVYFSSDGVDREGTVSDGITTYHFKTPGAASISGANAVLAPATDTTEAGYLVGANYAVFSGLSGSSRTISVQMRDNDEWGGIAGFQIIADLTGFPEFGLHPQDQRVPLGQSATFTAAAAADPAPEYQWEYSVDGSTGWTELENEMSATLTLPSVAFEDERHYRVVARNANGSTTSESAFLDVYYPPPTIIIQPVKTYAVENSSVELSVLAFGNGDLTYQWYKNGSLLDDATLETLALTEVDGDDDGIYHVEITDSVEEGLVTVSESVTVATFPAWDGLVSHDAFDTSAGYALGELPLQDAPVDGYTGAWAAVDFGAAAPEVLSGPLVYPNPLYLGSSGGHVGKAADAIGIAAGNSGRTYRKLAPALVVAGNTTGARYLSWLYRNGNENAADSPYVHSVLSLYQDTGGAAPAGDSALRTFEAGISDFDFGSSNFGFRLNDFLTGELGVPVDSDVHLFVVKFELSDSGEGDRVTVWIDPALGAGEPASGVTIEGWEIAFDSIALSDYASNSVAWDEVRWGSSFESVTLNPNPPPGFSAWIANHPGVGILDGFNDDPDRDGIPNGLENVFGTNPATPNPGISNVSRNGNALTFEHPQNPAVASDVTPVFLWSSDLTQWQASGAAIGGTTVTFSSSRNNPIAGMSTVTGTIAGLVPTSLFVRLKAVQNVP